MSTEDELLRLAADNLGPWARVWVAHDFSFAGSEHAERVALREDLRAAGLGCEPGEIGSDEEIRGDGYWHIWAFTLAQAEGEALMVLDRAARAAADRRGTHYDGWRIMRDPVTGALRGR